MPNYYKNKVIYNGRTLIDLSNDTVTKPEHVIYGHSFHTASGRRTVGIVEPPLNDVNFYDFTGTRLYSYTASEAEALTKMPDNPTFGLATDIAERRKYNIYGDLFSDGWNYTLQQMKYTLSSCGKCDVGGLYKTYDSIYSPSSWSVAPTFIYFSLPTYRNIFYLTLCVNGTITIECYNACYDYEYNSYTLSGTSLNSYVTVQIAPPFGEGSSFEDYVLKITPSDNTQFRFYGTEQKGSLLFSKHPSTGTIEENAVFQSAIQAIELGDGIEAIGDYAFKNLPNLETITFPSYINKWSTDGSNVARGTFDNCYKLKHVNFPYGLASPDCFENCVGLKTVSLPDSLTNSGNFHGSSIEKIYYPDSMYCFSSDFSDCKNLKSIHVRTTMEWTNSLSFQNCVNLEEFYCGSGGGDSYLGWNIPDYLFYNCIKLDYIRPSDIASCGNSSFKNCKGLNFELYFGGNPETIGNNCFEGCVTVQVLYLSSTILSIGSKAFKDCCGLKIIVCENNTPPTIQSDTFENLPSDCVIYVPDGCLNEYTTAPYWSALASQMQEGDPFTIYE